MLTGEENLRMMARLRHLPPRAARDRAAQLLAAFDLADARRRLVKTYSGGMRRRLDLAVSMIARPELLFLDEPTTGLDPRSRDQLWSAVKGLADDGVTVLLTTQYLAEAEQLADHVAVLHQGRIVAEGTAGQLKSGLGADEPGRGVPRAHRLGRRHEPATRPTTAHDDAAAATPQPGGNPMSAAVTPATHALPTAPPTSLTDTRVMIARSLRRSVRDPEAFITALALPGHPDAAVRLRLRRRVQRRRRHRAAATSTTWCPD